MEIKLLSPAGINFLYDKRMNKLQKNAIIFDLNLKIDPIIRIVGDKIWGRRILEDDFNLPKYLETYSDEKYMKFFGGWKKKSEKEIKNKCKDEAMKSELFLMQKNSLILMFLDHELNFFRFGIFLTKFSEILEIIPANQKENFLKNFHSIANNFDKKNDMILEIGYTSSLENKGKGFGQKVLDLITQNKNQIFHLFKEANGFSSQEEKNYFIATYHPENLPSEKLLSNNNFLQISNQSFYIEKYSAPRNFVIHKV